MSSVKRHLPHTFGKERNGFLCGTVYLLTMQVESCLISASSLIMQVKPLTAKDVLKSRQEGIAIKKYHADNRVFASNAFKGECDILKQ